MKNKFALLAILLVLILIFSSCTPQLNKAKATGKWKPYKVEYNETFYSIENWNNSFEETFNIISIDLYDDGNGKVTIAREDFSYTISNDCTWDTFGDSFLITGDGFMFFQLWPTGEFLTQTANMNDKSITIYYKKSI